MATAQSSFTIRPAAPTSEDPYTYQPGFGNSFASEAIPGCLPIGQNSPQKVKFGLYAEQLTATAFVAPRATNQKLWMYRMRPSVAHQGFTRMQDNPDMESNFLPMNPKVHVSPTQVAWRPFALPKDGEKVDFVDGLKTLAGTGEPSLKSGLAIHMYLANTDMVHRAYINNDGDMLIVPQLGRLDIQTELGHLMVKPGEICVIQRGLRFKVKLPDGPSRGYIQEVYGAHYKLPELGPLGANGLANPRDFEHPVASFDVDQSGWEIVYKLQVMSSQNGNHLVMLSRTFAVRCGRLAWELWVNWIPPIKPPRHSSRILADVPYKYDMFRFVNVGSISVDHIDPSIFCVLTVDSQEEGTPLADFLIFAPRWDVASNTFRPPYFHRNAASEFMGLVLGDYGGRSDDFAPGGASYECGHVPHGVDYPTFKAASEIEQNGAQWISDKTIAIMFESSRGFTLTDWAITGSGTIHYHEPSQSNIIPFTAKMWDPLESEFIERLDEVNAHLATFGLAAIEKGNAVKGNKGLKSRYVEGGKGIQGTKH
ncbi:homogentisate 1,2-dioxygenase, partial [Phenoliferia sp. Uapishka_3]